MEFEVKCRVYDTVAELVDVTADSMSSSSDYIIFSNGKGVDHRIVALFEKEKAIYAKQK